MEEYDENKAVCHINAALKAKNGEGYHEDEILNVIDMIWDYYEENGLLEIDDDFENEDEDIEADLVDYVKRMLRKDRESKIRPEDIVTIVRAELDYEDSTLNDL